MLFRSDQSNCITSLEIDPCGQVLLTGSEGQGMRFAHEPSGLGGFGTYRPLHGYHGSLTRDAQGWDFYAKDGTRHHLDSQGFSATNYQRIKWIEDTNGNRVTLNWALVHGQPVLTSVQDSAGRSLVFSYDGVASGALRAGGFEIGRAHV